MIAVFKVRTSQIFQDSSSKFTKNYNCSQVKYLLAMSLFSLIFGCRDKKTPEAARAWPQFPASDNPALHIEPVALDSGFGLYSFFIDPKGESVYVLAFRQTVAQPRTPYERAEAEAGIFRLDQQGKVLKRLLIPESRLISGASFGMLDEQLLVLLWQRFAIVDPEKMRIVGEIPVYDDKFFPSKQPLDEMTFDELRDNYALALDAALDRCKEGRWLDWTPGGAWFVLATAPDGSRAAWSPPTYFDEDLEPLKKRFPPAAPALPEHPEGLITDGNGSLREVEYLSGGTQLDYPNYKSRLIKQHELRLGEKTARFSTSDRNRHDLHLGLADNLRLTTTDGAAWVSFEGVLYRMK